MNFCKHLTTNHFPGLGISVIFDLTFLPGVGNFTEFFGKCQIPALCPTFSTPPPPLPVPGLTLIGALNKHIIIFNHSSLLLNNSLPQHETPLYKYFFKYQPLQIVSTLGYKLYGPFYAYIGTDHTLQKPQVRILIN